MNTLVCSNISTYIYSWFDVFLYILLFQLLSLNLFGNNLAMLFSGNWFTSLFTSSSCIIGEWMNEWIANFVEPVLFVKDFAQHLNIHFVSISSWISWWINEWLNDYMNEWMNEWMNVKINEKSNEWTNEWMNEWMNE